VRTIAAAAAVTAAAVSIRAQQRRQDDLSDEVAVVTGASRGLGLLLAAELAGQGCRLVICARSEDELEQAASRLRENGADVVAIACDVTSEDAAAQLVDAATAHYGRLDIVISNAGIIRVGPVESTASADYEAAVATMALAPVRLALAALPAMQKQGTAGSSPSPRLAASSACRTCCRTARPSSRQWGSPKACAPSWALARSP
jgi:NAD(P)-dependent dehydrogenase (short-subunit alcohol dehydrogenase family)